MANSSVRINYSYFGPPPTHSAFDWTGFVYQLDGAARNLPFKKFVIDTPIGQRVFVTYADSIDGIPPLGEATDPSVVVSNTHWTAPGPPPTHR